MKQDLATAYRQMKRLSPVQRYSDYQKSRGFIEAII